MRNVALIYIHAGNAETELSHALQALPSASHVQVPPPVTVISSTNTNGQENTDVISAPSDSMLAEVLNGML